MADLEQEDIASSSYPFSVDTWPSSSSRRRHRHFFLSHAHLDHTRGIEAFDSFGPIYCTFLTARLVLLRHPKMDISSFSVINVEEPKVVEDDDGSFTVTAYDANHCPDKLALVCSRNHCPLRRRRILIRISDDFTGAVMFLFEGNFGTVLHTGDCCLTPQCYGRLPRRLFGGLVDCLFLDCTFAKESVRMPEREDAVNQVKQCIWNHPDAPIVYLACDLLGQEQLLKSLSLSFGVKIYVDKQNLSEFYGSLALIAPEIMTDDPKSTRFHVCEGFPKLYERAKQKFSIAYAKGEPEPLFIRPSAQWYTYGERLEGVGSGLLLLEEIYDKPPSTTKRKTKAAPTQAERDPFGVWHVCYTMHSSQEVLEQFLSKLKPGNVISTIPHCKATELSYVRNLRQSRTHGKPQSSTKSIPRCIKAVARVKDSPSEHQSAIKQVQDAVDSQLQESSSPVREIPLFGRAVAGMLQSPSASFETEDGCCSGDDESSAESNETLNQLQVIHHSETEDLQVSPSLKSSMNAPVLNVDNETAGKCSTADNKGIVQAFTKENVIEEQIAQLVSPKKIESINAPFRSTPNYCGLGETTRRVYRSLNMVVPRPLPSLLELDREIKRSRF